MTESVLAYLVKRVGAAFNMTQISNEIVEEKWLNLRLNADAITTAKRSDVYPRLCSMTD